MICPVLHSTALDRSVSIEILNCVDNTVLSSAELHIPHTVCLSFIRYHKLVFFLMTCLIQEFYLLRRCFIKSLVGFKMYLALSTDKIGQDASVNHRVAI